MAVGEVAEVRLNAGEPLENVPRSLREEGHEVLSLEPEAAAAADGAKGVHILKFRRC
jgi:TusA-related sulfurtransferase